MSVSDTSAAANITEAVLCVTGGAGFIGANFVRRALSRTAARIVVADALTYAGNLRNLDGVFDNPRVTFERVDIADAPAVHGLFARHPITAVVNFAAETHVDRSIDGPAVFVRTNVVGTSVLLEATRQLVSSRDADVRERFRFLHVSTDEVFGTLGETGRFSETTPYAPNSPYAATKAAADHLVRAYHHTYGLPTLITNCSNNYGPYQFPEKLIPLTILHALDGEPIPIYGTGNNVRDWLHVEDHCDAILRVLLAGKAGENYNIGGDGERTNLQVVDEICALLDELSPVARNPAIARQKLRAYAALKTFVADRPGHDHRYAIDASKIGADLAWRPAYGFAEGLRQTVSWYVTHRDWCSEVLTGRYGRERLGRPSRG